MNNTNASQTWSSIDGLLQYCNQDDPLKEVWLWAQVIGLTIAIAVSECILFSISNGLVITYSAIMTRLCCMDFDLNAFSAWQDAATSISMITGLTVAVAAAFYKLWLTAHFGSAAVKRNLHLALNLEDTAKLCLSLLPPDVRLRRGTPVEGQLTVSVQLESSNICTRHLIVRTLFVDTNETAVIINAVPVLNGQWGLLSAFFSDFGRNKEQVESIVDVLKPYMARSRRRRESSGKRKTGKVQSQDQILREAPPRFFEKNKGLNEKSHVARRTIGGKATRPGLF